MKEQISHSMIHLEEAHAVFDMAAHKSTRKMSQKMKRNLSGRFVTEFTGKAVDLLGRSFIEIGSDTGSAFVSYSSVGNSEIKENQPVHFISGACLFGADGLSGKDAQGSHVSLTDPFGSSPVGEIQGVEQSFAVHPSEIESVLRTTGALTLLAGSESTHSDKLTFHLPVPEYFMYLLKLKQMMALSRETALDTAKMVMERGEALATMFSQRMPTSIDVLFDSPLQSIAQELLDSNFEMELEDIVVMLSNQNILWKQLLEHFPPEDVTEINYLSYTHLYHTVQKQAQAEGRACLAVEESKESRILTEAKKQSQMLGRELTMGALYVAPKILSRVGMHNKHDLFMHDTTQDGRLKQLKTVVNVYKGGV